jgi:hypothetical protein
MYKQNLECTLNSIDINKDIIKLNSKDNAFKKFAAYHETISRISKGKLYLNNNYKDRKADKKFGSLNSKTFKFKAYKCKLSNIEKIEDATSLNLGSTNGINNKKLFEIIKLKASFDETKQRLHTEFSSENDVLYSRILKLSDKLDKIFDASIKIKE